TWIDHAFVNFNPKLFRSIAEANQYEIVLEDFHVPPAAENPAEEPRRYGASNGHPHETMTRRLPALLNALSVPSNMLYMVVLRKTTEAEFAVPYDVAAS
ncbi:MAG TPA: hypothetical protein VFS39_01950, partial [Nitrospira sp.]|nr:hypothetical protein [Nitrospira sp.]